VWTTSFFYPRFVPTGHFKRREFVHRAIRVLKNVNLVILPLPSVTTMNENICRWGQRRYDWMLFSYKDQSSASLRSFYEIFKNIFNYFCYLYQKRSKVPY